MASLQFEGEVQSFSEQQINFVKDVLEKRGYQNNKVLIETVGQKGNNYIATILRIIVQNKDGKPFKMIAKAASSLEAVRIMMNQTLMFANEILMYTEVLPKFVELQRAAEVPESEIFRFPVCYGALSEQPNELILIEDLNDLDYVIFDRLESLSEESMKLAIKNLAMMHSFSYALKDKEPQTFDILGKKLINLWAALGQGSQDVHMYFKMIENDIISLMEDDKYKNAIKNTASQIISIATKLYKFEQTSKFSVIQHGDCWSSNILFKSEDGKPVSAVLIDYQMSRECSPANDLLYLIFNCTSYEIRSKNMNDWLDYYHTELSKFLANFGLKSNFVYPRDQLDAELRIYAKFILAQTCILATVILRETSDVVDMKDIADTINDDVKKNINPVTILQLNEKTLERFRSRLCGTIDSLLELGCL